MRASHIIPEFLYGPAYDAKHRINQLSGDAAVKFPLIQKGLRDRLLCGDCECFLNKTYEQPFCKYWDNQQRLYGAAIGKSFRLDGFDYHKFKLFHLCNLWRASIATTEDFDSVSLGPYEEWIRSRLLAQDAGRPDEIPIVGIVMIDENGLPRADVISKPQDSRYVLQDVRCTHYLCYGGVDWVFFITRGVGIELGKFANAFPQVNGTMLLWGLHWLEASSAKTLLQQRRKSTPV